MKFNTTIIPPLCFKKQYKDIMDELDAQYMFAKTGDIRKEIKYYVYNSKIKFIFVDVLLNAVLIRFTPEFNGGMAMLYENGREEEFLYDLKNGYGL